jgi:TM2 domain-containing membrane protein YozV
MDKPLKPATASRRCSVAVAYLLCLLFGLLGLHRLYLGRGMSAAAMAAITLVSLPLLGSGLGLLGFVATGTWMLSDLVLIPGMAREANAGEAAAAFA